MTRQIRRPAVVATAAALLAVSLAGAATATTPAPRAGHAAGATTTPAGDLHVFYVRAADGGVTQKLFSGGRLTTTDRGGRFLAGTYATTTGTQDAWTWVFGTGANHAVYLGQYFEDQRFWSPWSSLGGWASGTPTASCDPYNAGPQPTIWVRGSDGALWWLAGKRPWQKVGGALHTDPTAIAGIAGNCGPGRDILAAGTDDAVWEWRETGWSRVGGRTYLTPTAVHLPDGSDVLFVVGTDRALWTAKRPAGAPSWSAFSRVGGSWTSPPSAQVVPGTPATFAIVGLGGNGQLYRAQNAVGGTDPWTFTAVP